MDVKSPECFDLGPIPCLKYNFLVLFVFLKCVVFFLPFHALYRWDCSFQYGSLVEEVDGHTALLYHRLQLDWFPM